MLSPEIDSIWHVVNNNILMCQQSKFAFESVNYTALRCTHSATSNYFVYRSEFLSLVTRHNTRKLFFHQLKTPELNDTDLMKCKQYVHGECHIL